MQLSMSKPGQNARSTLRTFVKGFSASLIISLLLLTTVACLQSSSRSSDSEISRRLSAYIVQFVETGNFTGAVLVARRDQILFRQAYGMANYELQVPNTPTMRFHIASVSKAFTAAAILQLQEQGRLNFSDTVSRFVSGFPQGNRITLDNLLTHTSGIPDINDLPEYDVFARSPHLLPELVGKVANLPLQFDPGTKYSYSNSNYNLLALILEKVSGESYTLYLGRHIFEPAGMEESGHDGVASDFIPFAASGYAPAGVKGFEKAAYVDWSTKTGNGSLYSTVDDLYRFDRALNGESVLKAGSRQKYFVEGEGNRYGWYIGQRLGHRIMSAKGRSPGFTAELDRFFDDDVTIVLLSNSYSRVIQDPIAEALAAIVFGQERQTPAMKPEPIPQSTLASYSGRYKYGPDYFVPDANFTLTAEAGYLLLQLGDTRTPLVPLSPTDFLERRFFGHVVMSKEDSGKMTGLTVQYGTKQFIARRLEAQ